MAISKNIKKKEPKNISSIREIDKQLGKESGQGATFGQYSEAHGGGTPAGGDFGGRGGRVGWDERKESGEHAPSDDPHRAEQPRTSDGKFTYNSVNGKETKYDGRGKTVNPLLTGGENGVKIDDVKQQFSDKAGSLYDKYKHIYYEKGSMKAGWNGKKFSTKIAAEDIWEVAKYSFDVEKGEFGGKKYSRWQKLRGKQDVTGESEMFAQTKKGRSTKEESLAKETASKKGKEQYVTKENDTAIIKIGDRTFTVKKTTAQGPQSLKHSQADIQRVRDLAKQRGVDLSNVTDEQIDQIVDDFLDL